MSDSREEITRSQLAAIAASVTGLTGSGRVSLGVKNFSLSDGFFKNLADDGAGHINPFLQIRNWRRSNLSAFGTGGTFFFEIDARLYYGYAKNADYDGKTIGNILSALMDAWILPASYIVDNERVANAPVDASNGDPQENRELNPCVGMFPINLRFAGCVG